VKDFAANSDGGANRCISLPHNSDLPVQNRR
jgi:hypothetical protein